MDDDTEKTPAHLVGEFRRLQGELAELFHRCWGNAIDGKYVKKDWNRLQEILWTVGALKQPR